MRSAVWKDVLCRSSDSNSKPYELSAWAAVLSFWRKEKPLWPSLCFSSVQGPATIPGFQPWAGEHVRSQKPVRRALLVEGLGLLLISRSAHWLRNTKGDVINPLCPLGSTAGAPTYSHCEFFLSLWLANLKTQTHHKNEVPSPLVGKKACS